MCIRDRIRGVFELDESTVREAMVPRTQIRALAQDTTLGEALRYFRDIPHARFPVYEESLDRITGVVAIKELLTFVAEHSASDNFKHVSRKPVDVYKRQDQSGVGRPHPRPAWPQSSPDGDLRPQTSDEDGEPDAHRVALRDAFGGADRLFDEEEVGAHPTVREDRRAPGRRPEAGLDPHRPEATPRPDGQVGDLVAQVARHDNVVPPAGALGPRHARVELHRLHDVERRADLRHHVSWRRRLNRAG